jgi:hypothetical protein
MTDGDGFDSDFALKATVLATVIGSVVVLVLLLWPMSIPMSGYHDGWDPSCGPPVAMDLSAFPPPTEKVDGWYPGAAARERCEGKRADRFARAGAVATVTAGVVALFFVYRWTRRRLYATDVQK